MIDLLHRDSDKCATHKYPTNISRMHSHQIQITVQHATNVRTNRMCIYSPLFTKSDTRDTHEIYMKTTRDENAKKRIYRRQKPRKLSELHETRAFSNEATDELNCIWGSDAE